MGAAQTDLRTDLHDEIEAFLARMDADARSPHTVKSYRTSLAAFVAWLGEIAPDTAAGSITPTQIQEWVDAMTEAGSKPSTVKTRLRGVQRFYKHAVEVEWTTDNPAKGIHSPHVRAPRIEFPERDDLNRLLKMCFRDKSYAGKRDLAILRLMIDTGARRAEIGNLAIRREFVDFNATRNDSDAPSGYVDTDKRVVHIRGKSGASRTCSFDPDTNKAIRSYMRARDEKKGRRDNHWLWLSRTVDRDGSDGARLLPTAINRIFERRCRDADVRKPDGTVFTSVHALRHFWAHHALRRGMDVLEVQRLGGWTSLEMLSQRYGQSLSNERAIEKARSLPPMF